MVPSSLDVSGHQVFAYVERLSLPVEQKVSHLIGDVGVRKLGGLGEPACQDLVHALARLVHRQVANVFVQDKPVDFSQGCRVGL